MIISVLAACGGHREVPAPAPTDARRIDARAPALLDGVEQLIVGTTDGWDATSAELVRYERVGGAWKELGRLDAVVGADGLAWGSGLHGDGAPEGRGGPLKIEGDDRSPAGAFRVLRAYGWADDAPGALPYAHLADSWRCVDDPASPHYNQVFDARGVERDWSSAEEMRGYGELYRWVVELEVRAGSCIFLHVWSGADSATAGCTAMPRAELEALLRWLRPGAVYVLLTRADRDALAAAWGLPAGLPD